MKCDHTKRPFAIITKPESLSQLLVLPAQLEQVKSVLIRANVMFVVNFDGAQVDNVRFRVVCFRADADTTAIEAVLAKH